MYRKRCLSQSSSRMRSKEYFIHNLVIWWLGFVRIMSMRFCYWADISKRPDCAPFQLVWVVLAFSLLMPPECPFPETRSYFFAQSRSIAEPKVFIFSSLVTNTDLQKQWFLNFVKYWLWFSKIFAFTMLR